MNKIYVIGDNRIPHEALRQLTNSGMQVIELNSFYIEEPSEMLFGVEALNLFDSQSEIVEHSKPKSTKYTSSIGHFDKYLK